MTKEEKIIRKKQERKEFKAYIDLSDDRVLNTKKAGIELIAKDEIFVQIPDAEHYWISNYGRLVNNNNKHKTFKFHKMPENNKKVHWTVVSYDIDGSPIHTETNPTELVAKYFLMKNNIARWKVWHIDRNFSNNYYKNLIFVTPDNYNRLRTENITVEDLGYEQDYYTYYKVSNNVARNIYKGIYARCYGSNSLMVNKCYDGAFMCDKWRDDPESFEEWYSMNYYECDGERMAVDKDLLYRGNREYSPEKCCLLPETINSALASATKRRVLNTFSKMPLGVYYASGRDQYYAQIHPFGTDCKAVKLHYWDTEMEAFNEYKMFKEAELKVLALRYRDKIPDEVFDALITYEVCPYSPYDPRSEGYSNFRRVDQ